MAAEDKELRAALRRLDAAIVRQEKILKDALASDVGAPAASPLRHDLLVMRDEAARLRRRLLVP